MAGQKIVLSGISFTDSSLPEIRDDPILSSGSLLLMDLGHSMGVFTGIPADASLLPNIVGDDAPFRLSGAFPAGTGLIERSGKGGLHVIRSKTISSTVEAAIRLPTTIKSYLESHLSNRYYFSVWQRVTRAFSTDTARYITSLASATSPSSNSLLTINQNGVYAFSNVNNLDKSSGFDVVGNNIQQVDFDGVNGTVTTLGYDRAVIFGGYGGGVAAGLGGGSQIFYRLYLEDLTVSGRTYAAVKAIDDALYAAAFAEGGKFYGDTYTDPATLP